MNLKCPICASTFKFGEGQYNGKHIKQYQITVCRSCFEGNWDGWAPHLENKLIEACESQDIALPERNEKGLYPRGE